MEDNSSYTYTYNADDIENQKPEKSLKAIFAVIIVLFLIAAVVLGVFFAKKKAQSDAETTTIPETTAEANMPMTEPVTQAPTYEAGTYSVNTGDVGILFRKDHAQSAETIVEIPDKTQLSITEIYTDDTATSEDYKYWGKTKYLGYEGWVTMKYLKKGLPEDVVTPDSYNTTEPETIATVNSGTTVGNYTAGEYKVSAEGSYLRFKQTPGRNTQVLGSVPDGTVVNVIEIVEIEETDDVYRYWGKISYNGYEGYISMAYLTKNN